ncbi:hypothetical protein Tco_0791404 [Tanacetum coccineum]
MERIGLLAYRLRLPQELNGIHDTFYVSISKECWKPTTSTFTLEEIQVDSKLNFVEELVEILEREIKKLKRSRIPIVKGEISFKGDRLISDCVDRRFSLQTAQMSNKAFRHVRS